MTLYQYTVCPWCNKARAALDYCKVPYHAVEVHPLFRAELKWSAYKKVPVLLLPNGDQVNDSSAIVDELWQRHRPEVASKPEESTKRGCAHAPRCSCGCDINIVRGTACSCIACACIAGRAYVRPVKPCASRSHCRRCASRRLAVVTL